VTTVGLVGGLGPESTIDYYRRIQKAWEKHDPSSHPSIILDSLDVQKTMRLVATDRAALIVYLRASLDRLAAAGADFIAITANTPHIVFDELAAESSVPLISIVEVCADAVQQLGLKRPLLLATRFTVDAPFYPEVLARRSVTVVLPREPDKTWIHDRYVTELLKGDFRDATRTQFLALVERFREQHDIDGVILGGTELPLLLNAPSIAGLPVLDTTALHVDAIIERLTGSDSRA
jgi:aspartate racemase